MPDQPPDHSDETTESDPRLPSGPWRGQFAQPLLGIANGRMLLELTFKEGKVTGSGSDIVSSFSIGGVYDLDSGEVRFQKRYHGMHGVLYRGFAEHRHNGIWGLWDIPSFDRGGYRIWPEGNEHHVALDESIEAPASAEDRLVVVDFGDE